MTTLVTNADAARLAKLLVEQTDRSSAPTNLHDRVAQLAFAIGYGQTPNESQELVEPLLPEIQAVTVRLRNEAEQEGTTWHIELFGSEGEWIRGSSFEDLSLDLVDRGIRARRAHDADVLSEIVNLTPAEFERACTTVLKRLGCSEPHTSSFRNDGGIDFYGSLALKGRLDSPLPLGGIDSRVKVWLIGQAKHYPTSAIEPAVIRELVGSVELARTRGAIHAWPGLSMQPFDATLMLVFTTGWFSTGSKALLTQSGMIAMNGMQLAAFLCDVGVGFAGEPPTFDPSKFKDELLGPS